MTRCNVLCTVLQSEPVQRLFINKLREVGVAWQKQLPNPAPRSSRSLLCSVHAIRNTRRKMEDRHVILPEFNQLLGLQVRLRLGLNLLSCSARPYHHSVKVSFSSWAFKSNCPQTKVNININNINNISLCYVMYLPARN